MNRPLYTYDYPEQWNPKNPFYPLPPYPGRKPAPTAAELEAAKAFAAGTAVLLANPSQDAESAEFVETQPAYTF
jgi:hypothetical protein